MTGQEVRMTGREVRMTGAGRTGEVIVTEIMKLFVSLESD